MNEFAVQAISGSSVYALIRNSSDQIWSVAGSAWVTFVDANIAQYALALTEQGTSGFFSGNFPTLITQADNYAVTLFYGTGSESDQQASPGGNLPWNGQAASYSPSNGALTTLAYVKDYGNIQNTLADGYLQNRIYGASAAAERWSNRTFALTSYTECYEGADSDTLQLNQNPVTAVTSVTFNFQSAFPVVVPGSAVIINSKQGLISINHNSTYPSWFPYGFNQQNIQVIYQAGFATVPTDIQEAVADTVISSLFSRGVDLSMRSEKMLDYSYQRFEKPMYLTDRAQVLLFPYKNLVA